MAADSGTYDPETVARHQRIADTLLKQAAAPREIRSRLQGVGQLGEGLIAGLESGWADKESKDARAAMIAQGLQAYGVGAPPAAAPNAAAPVADATAGPPTVAPTGSGFVLPPTERTYAENELNPIDAKIATPSELAAGANISPKDMNIGARTVIGEAGGYKPRDKQAVAAVLLNRARMAGTSPAEEALKPNQFEPWNTEAGRSRMMAPSDSSPAYQDAARAIFMASQADPTGGATHFYSPTAQASLGRRPPNWDTGDGTDIGPHRFFNKPYGNVAAALTAPQATAYADAGPPQSDVAAPPWQLADRFNASYGNRAPVPQQQASLPPPRVAPQAVPPPQAAPAPASGAPGVAAALNAPVQVAQNAPQQGSREAQVRFGLNPWTPPAAASAVLGQLTPKPQAMKITNRDGSESIVFVDPNKGTITGAGGKPVDTESGPPNPTLSGDDYLKSIPTGRRELITGMLEGRIGPAQLGRYGTKQVQSLLEDAAKVEPNFDLTTWKGREAGIKDFYGGGKSQQTVRSLNQSALHFGELVDKMAALPGHAIPSANAAENFINTQLLGKASAPNFELNAHALADELATIFKGAGISDSEIRSWESRITPNMSDEQQRGMAKTVLGLYRDAFTAQEKKRQDSLGPTLAGRREGLIGPEAESALARIEKFTGGQNVNGAPAQAPIKVSSPEEARKLPKGTAIILPDGSPGVVP